MHLDGLEDLDPTPQPPGVRRRFLVAVRLEVGVDALSRIPAEVDPEPHGTTWKRRSTFRLRGLSKVLRAVLTRRQYHDCLGSGTFLLGRPHDDPAQRGQLPRRVWCPTHRVPP